MNNLLILFIIVILIITKSSFKDTTTVPSTYTLGTPFGATTSVKETYNIPVNNLKSENIKLTYNQYLVFVKYMNNPKIINFMSDNSKIKLNLDQIQVSYFNEIATTGTPSIIHGDTISYNQAVGINAGTSTSKGQSDPPTNFQIARTLLIVMILGSLAKLYCLDSTLNMDTKTKEFVSNCASGDIVLELDRFYFFKSIKNVSSLNPLSLDYNTHAAIWYALNNRYNELSQRLNSDVYKTL